MIDTELIQKFLAQQCTAEEASLVTQHFYEHPEAWEQYLSEAEWQDFETDKKLSTNISKRIFDHIQSQTREKKPIIHLVKRMAVAASVVLALGIGWKYFSAPASTNVALNGKNEPILLHTANTSTVDTFLTLQDGTNIRLAPKSEIAYPDPFEANKRAVYLEGQAFFKVAKDKQRPFTVYSDAIATTALGTQFLVTSFNSMNDIHVKLFEGKVVVKSTDSIHKALAKDIYLTPGNELVYDKKNKLAQVHSFTDNNENGLSDKGNTPTSTGNHDLSAEWVQFDNQPLADVFSQLQDLYDVKISYNKDDIKKIAFIGKIDKTDSVEQVLRIICSLNNLSVQRNGNTYTVKK
jgi:ferric-dicitrate binding protein FerR (iron transport regulator)